VQITDARPDTGGLSGATLQEGKSWGKVQDSHENLITVYTDATIAFPILALYALSNEEPREPKRIYKNLGKYYETLQESAINVPEKFAEILKKSDINID
ncbi:MAG: deoxyhypusine synthase, partial [Candidatus Nitrosopelagicus sp.]|nr:deoxyhypusine synthase [Candidatus Nitrosopelagicus sp.]